MQGINAASRPETISELLENNESQIMAIIGRASAIREKVAGSDYSQCTKSNAPTEAYPGIPGIYRHLKTRSCLPICTKLSWTLIQNYKEEE